ncbi:transcription initiation Spt4-like protein [Striga asiatica]|uniref:Transcription initiation Spt4-like protein n=1 Tax=Striga asiatica TaxID=4170 RepID=A0A5A7P2N2_STRAF|nr:transcription initiation Spt4-like protein [Striga asiatica]
MSAAAQIPGGLGLEAGCLLRQLVANWYKKVADDGVSCCWWLAATGDELSEFTRANHDSCCKEDDRTSQGLSSEKLLVALGPEMKNHWSYYWLEKLVVFLQTTSDGVQT